LLPDHVHMLLSIPPKYAVSQVVGYINLEAAVGAEFSFRLRAASIPGCVSLVSDAEERARDGL
jgi:putative transposase